MIRVTLALEPDDFDQKVRQRGLRAIGELAGDVTDQGASGQRRAPVATSRKEIPPSAFPPYWRDALPEMFDSYRRLCAYLSLYIEQATGAHSVDHMIPKSKSWDQVYEWANYRLAAALMNARKGDADSVLDPFEISDDWFALELVAFQVKPGSGADGEIGTRVQETIDRLNLNDSSCCGARQEYVEAYLGEEAISLAYLERRAPFIARELRRQGRLREGDE